MTILFFCLFGVVFFSYGITNSAYRNLQDQNENQCVCILGENGSGKTESARIILHFLSNVHSDHTLSGKKILHNQNSTRLMRCKSLASYPKYELPEATISRSGKRDSIKFARKSHVSCLTTVEYHELVPRVKIITQFIVIFLPFFFLIYVFFFFK